MKSIYVSRYEKQLKHSKWPYLAVLFLAVILLIARVVATVIAENLINRKGADGKGYHFRVAEVRMNILKGEVNLRDLKVFKPADMTIFAEAPEVALNFKWADLIRGNYILDVKANQLNLILFKALFDEVQRIKRQASRLDKLVASVERIHVKEADEINSRTILTLLNSKVSWKQSEFSLIAKVAEGGSIDLKRKSSEKENSTPWSIESNLTKIRPDVLEKLTGSKLPIDITEPNLNANIVARTHEGQIEGTLTPDITEFNAREERKSAWGDIIVKVKNYNLESANASKEIVKLDIPFIIRDKLRLSFDETISRVKSQVKSKVLAL
jgi:hypothetical protein